MFSLLVLLCTLGGAFGLGAWLTLRVAVRRSPEVTVPNLAGVDAERAAQALRAVGLAPEISGRRYDPKQAEGTVLTQMPPAGSSTRPGRPVRLIVSLGARRAAVPDLSGSSQARAQLALRGAGLAPAAVVAVPAGGVPAGRVIGQHPPGGTEAGPGDGVALLVGAGPPPRAFVMPDLAGWPIARAAGALERAGFRRVRTEGTPGAPVGGQQPKAGFAVRADDPIVLTAGGTT